MTEITENTVQNPALPPALEAFVLQWGDLGGEWGVNRSVSQIHAWLFLAEVPLNAEDICRDLGMARSNVSNSLKELMAWNLISRVPVRGERRDHFVAETDVWEIAARIASARKAREIDPALSALQRCVAEASEDGSVTNVQRKRLKSMLEFTRSVDRWYGQMLSLSRPKRQALLKMGARISAFLPGGDNAR